VNCSDPETPCVQKCCSHDEIYSLGMNGKPGGCLPVNSMENKKVPHWSPTFYESLDKKLIAKENKTLNMHPHLIHKNPSSFKGLCSNKVTTVYPYGEKVSEFLTNVLKRPFPHLK